MEGKGRLENLVTTQLHTLVYDLSYNGSIPSTRSTFATPAWRSSNVIAVKRSLGSFFRFYPLPFDVLLSLISSMAICLAIRFNA